MTAGIKMLLYLKKFEIKDTIQIEIREKKELLCKQALQVLKIIADKLHSL
jgi:hypothetical protein